MASFLSRHSSAGVLVDELYHENSKLSRVKVEFGDIAGCLQAVQEETHRMEEGMIASLKTFVKLGGMFREVESLPDVPRKIVETMASSLPPYVGFYVLMAEDHRATLYRFLRPHYLMLTKQEGLEMFEKCEENSFLPEHPDGKQRRFSMVVALYGNHMMARAAFGLRGYRVVLAECGRLIHSAERTLEQQHQSLTSTVVFRDNALNAIVGMDGRVCSVHGLIFVEE
ncbi:MAG: hypothetical protein FJ215_10775 [Ignavibacteria bacterium]|nr:hypothetical protein [Ignavibacteria bacterium]